MENRIKLTLLALTLTGVFYNAPCKAQNKTLKKIDSSHLVINPNVKEIIVICKTHFDIGYTHRVKDVVHYYQTDMIDRALATMEQSKGMPKQQQFQWTTPGWVMSKVLEDWPGQTPERRRKLDSAFRAGKFITHALPFTLETDACEPEEMARSLGFATELAHKYNMPLPGSAKVTDVPSHGGQMATVLANGGVKFLHIGCNWPSAYIKTPGLFWWEGPDGSRILTMYSALYGSTQFGLMPSKVDWGSIFPQIGQNLLPAKDWPYKTWPAIIVTIDNSGPPTAEQIKALFDEVSKKMPGVKVRMGTMDDFAVAIFKENPKLPVVKGEMPDTWIQGIMCDPEGRRLSRQAHPLLASSEVMNTQLRGWGVNEPSISNSIASAYEKLELYGDHTWGGYLSVNEYGDDFKKLPEKKYADLEGSWEDKTDYIRDASKLTNAMSDTNMTNLARSIKHGGSGVLVYNPLPWQRSGFVEVNGKSFYAENVPASGYKTFPLEPASPASQPVTSNTIENEFFKITFDAQRGSIISLIDKRTGREWADANGNGIGQYMNERFTYEQTQKYDLEYQQGRGSEHYFGNAFDLHPGLYKPGMISEIKTPYRAMTAAGGTLKVSRDATSETAVLEMPGDSAKHMPKSELKVTLRPHEPFIDLEVTIKDKAKDNWPEADWLSLPFKVTNPVFHVYRPLGMMNPATDILPGADRDMYSVGNGVTITGPDGTGIAVCPVDHPLISLDRPGCWLFSTDFVPKKPVVYVNLYNNQWNTNYRYWYPGTWSSRVRIWTITKGTPKDQVIATPALEARNPLQARTLEPSNGSLPSEQSGLTVSRKGVTVTAFGADPNGNHGTLLRVWEQAGVSGKLKVTLPKGINALKAQPVNLRGEKTGQPVKIVSDSFEFDLHAYAPQSYILTSN